jgi:hypothetical protein
MNWDAMGAVAEFIVGVATVASCGRCATPTPSEDCEVKPPSQA